MFESTEISSRTAGLDLRYQLAPWDEETLGGKSAVISSIRLLNPAMAGGDFATFQRWCLEQRVRLVTCRLPHDGLAECGFLESMGFRFIELNYRPEKTGLQSTSFAVDGNVQVGVAQPEDEALLSSIAGQIFTEGRLHRDPMIDPQIGNLRYARWIANAFRNSRQTVLKCTEQGRLQGFFVVESPAADDRFWSLVGLAPGLGGRGLGTRVWNAMLDWHKQEGANRVSTSISSLNLSVFNLYVKLGFRYPAPEITLHWCPNGPIRRQE
jgi:RimJ/RimL family protein N-acetyltransferase